MFKSYLVDRYFYVKLHTSTFAAIQIQVQLQKTERWLKKWKFQANMVKSVRVTFTLKKDI